MGDHEFRFYADLAPGAGAPSPAKPAEPRAPRLAPSSPEAAKLQDTLNELPLPSPPPLPPRPSSSAPLATFLVRNGQLRGTRFPVRVPVVNIGRAEYNDLVIPDESVSSSHAKLTRREGVWVLTDNDSTNGTFVDAERVSGEAAISPGAVLRFGEVSVMFEPTDDHLGTAKGSGTKVMSAIAVPPVGEGPAAAPLPAGSPELEVPKTESRPSLETPAPARVSGGQKPIFVVTPQPKEEARWVVPAIVAAGLLVLAGLLFFLFGK